MAGLGRPLGLGLCLVLGCTQAPAPPDSGPAGPPDLGVKAAVVVPPGPPRRQANREELVQLEKKLSLMVQPGAIDPANPWALAHGLAAYGPDFKAKNGRLAVDVIADFLETKKFGDRTVYFFPEKTKDGTPVEPHPSMITKKMIEAGVPMSRVFKPKGKGKVTLEQLIRDRELEFTIPTTPEGWRTFAWSFTDFLKTREGQPNIEAAAGPLDINDLSRRALFELEAETDFLLTLMKDARPDLLQKKKQGIYAHTCGGFHFVQAVLLGAKRIDDPEILARARRQLDIARFRFDGERRIYQAMIRSQPQYRLLLLVQELKFYGHLLETFGFARQWGVSEGSPEEETFVAEVAADLADTVRELESAFQTQDEIKAKLPQTYYDLIGDGCHAIRGVRLALQGYFRG
ncbi:MAG: hypothetical protein IPG45_21100 [Deltaproteobacteria bacterium]|jgi:hypothetical protein|nr:hypothetical protein [Deltaproteobacteria bacterium]